MLSADDDSRVWVQNLSKTNPGGTMLNDDVVDQSKMLMDGDVISICGRRFRFEYAEPMQDAGNDDVTVAVPSFAKPKKAVAEEAPIMEAVA